MSLVYSITSDNATNFAYKFPYESMSDKRTQGWLLVDSFWNMISLVGIYLMLVHLLPKWLTRHKAYQLRKLLFIYNISLAMLNVHIFKELLLGSMRLHYNIWCQPCREIHSMNELRIASAVWWFYFSKFLEFSDTIFFILRKKWDQLSFLHVYHHSTMFPLWWIAIKWVPTGSTFLPAMVNSFVHIVMYSYYGLSTMGQSVNKYLWWKKHLTALQLVQFIVAVLWSLQAIYYNCDFPTWISYVNIIYMISFLILFGRFYVKKYQKINKLK